MIGAQPNGNGPTTVEAGLDMRQASDHGIPVDPKTRCQAPVRGGYRFCRNAALVPGQYHGLVVDRPYCYVHLMDATKLDREPEPGYVWEALIDPLFDRPCYWFQRRTPQAKRRALALDWSGEAFSGSCAARSEVWAFLRQKGFISPRQRKDQEVQS